jgi:hypothetical protein
MVEAKRASKLQSMADILKGIDTASAEAPDKLDAIINGTITAVQNSPGLMLDPDTGPAMNRWMQSLGDMQKVRTQATIGEANALEVQQMNQGFGKLGELGMRAAQAQGGWANPDIERSFHQIVQTYPGITRSPRFGLYEDNIQKAKTADMDSKKFEQAERKLTTFQNQVGVQTMREERLSSQPASNARIESLNGKIANSQAQIRTRLERGESEDSDEVKRLETQLAGLIAELDALRGGEPAVGGSGKTMLRYNPATDTFE